MKKYVLDTNLYIAADRSRDKAQELIDFYFAFLPMTYLHAVVAQELLVGAVAARGKQIHEALIAPFEARGRVVTPSFQAWKRSGEIVAGLIARRYLSPGGFGRSFLNDALLAASCRESGLTLVTANLEDFRLVRRIYPFDFVPPWPPA